MSAKTCLAMVLQAGDSLPDVAVYVGDRDVKVKLLDIFGGRKGVLFRSEVNVSKSNKKNKASLNSCLRTVKMPL